MHVIDTLPIGVRTWPIMHLAEAVRLIFLSFALAAGYQVEKSLNGDGWSVVDSAGKLRAPVQARVPGQVHLDLM